MSDERWYMMARDGRATLCADRADAEHEARNADTAWPAMGPHRAVQLVEAGFDACDMATASAQGFRDGVASVSAWSEPVPNNRPSLEEVFRRLSDRAYCNYIEQIGSDVCLGWEHKAAHGKLGEAELKGHTLAGEMLGRHKAFDEAANALRGSDAPLTYPAPQEGMAWWQPIESAPKDGQAILVTDGRDCYCVEWNEEFDWWTVDDNKLGPFRLRGSAPTHWVPTPAAPGPADGESNG